MNFLSKGLPGQQYRRTTTKADDFAGKCIPDVNTDRTNIQRKIYVKQLKYIRNYYPSDTFPFFPMCGIQTSGIVSRIPFNTIKSGQCTVDSEAAFTLGNYQLSIINYPLKRYHFRGGRIYTLSCLSSTMLSYLSLPGRLPFERNVRRRLPVFIDSVDLRFAPIQLTVEGIKVFIDNLSFIIYNSEKNLFTPHYIHFQSSLVRVDTSPRISHLSPSRTVASFSEELTINNEELAIKYNSLEAIS